MRFRKRSAHLLCLDSYCAGFSAPTQYLRFAFSKAHFHVWALFGSFFAVSATNNCVSTLAKTHILGTAVVSVSFSLRPYLINRYGHHPEALFRRWGPTPNWRRYDLGAKPPRNISGAGTPRQIGALKFGHETAAKSGNARTLLFRADPA